TVDAPPGVAVTRIIYPEPTDFDQIGQAQPLAVFEHRFVTEAEVTLAASLPAGELRIPGRLRCQACDDRVCFAPMTERFEWTLTVLGENGAGAESAAPPPDAPAPPPQPPSSSGAEATEEEAVQDAAALERFTTLGT